MCVLVHVMHNMYNIMYEILTIIQPLQFLPAVQLPLGH